MKQRRHSLFPQYPGNGPEISDCGHLKRYLHGPINPAADDEELCVICLLEDFIDSDGSERAAAGDLRARVDQLEEELFNLKRQLEGERAWHRAELSWRAEASDLLTELGAPAEKDGKYLTLAQRIRELARRLQKGGEA